MTELRLVPKAKTKRRHSASPRVHFTALPRPTVRTLAVTSGKGGVGKSNVVANLAVARAVLAPSLPIRPRFMRVPLDLREPNAAALLAGMVTLTPGTVSVDLDLDAWVLTVHALLADDEAAAVDAIKHRYEARIKEMFQC